MAASVGRGAIFIVAARRCGTALLLGTVVQTAGLLVVVAVDGHGWHGGVCWCVVGHARIGDEVVVDERVERGWVQKEQKA